MCVYMYLQLPDAGCYVVTQVCIATGGLRFLRNIPIEYVMFHVELTPARVEIVQKQGTFGVSRRIYTLGTCNQIQI